MSYKTQSSIVGNIRVVPVKTPSSYFPQIDAKFRQLVADTGVVEIKKNLQSGIFKNPTGALANSMQGAVESDKSIVWWSDLPHAGAQEHGVRPHAMWYLLNKTIPITSYSIGGERTVYRRATLKSFLQGKWFHKGYPGKFFMKRGIETTVSRIPELLRQAQDAVLKGMY